MSNGNGNGRQHSLQTSTPLSLHHLHITSAKPDALAHFYRQQFGLQEESAGTPYVLRGGARAVIISEGPPASLAWAGYALRNATDLAAFRIKLKAGGVRISEVDNPLYQAGAFEVADPQGRRLSFGVAKHVRTADAEPARLQHVVFQTTELEEIMRFYVEQIGFVVSDEVVDENGRVMVVFMRSDDEHHTIAFFRGSRNEWDHHCYETNEWNDIRDWGDKFGRQRIPIFFGPGRHGPGNNLFFMVNDPDGNRLELSAEMQVVSAETMPGVWEHSEYTLNSWGRAWIRT
jgi:catechol 2,3-dioxygenase